MKLQLTDNVITTKRRQYVEPIYQRRPVHVKQRPIVSPNTTRYPHSFRPYAHSDTIVVNTATSSSREPKRARKDQLAKKNSPMESRHTTTPELSQKVKPANEKNAKSKKRNLLLLFTMVIGAACIGIAFQSLQLGELVIGLYTVYAILRKIPSRNTFMLALISLIGVGVVQLLQGSDTDIGNNFAVYAYLLLVIGTVSMGLELRRDNERERNITTD